MRTNSNKNSLLKISLFAAVLSVLLVALFVVDCVNLSRYEKQQAIIVESDIKNSSGKTVKYIIIEYSQNDKNYKKEIHVASRIGKGVGKTQTIYVNPNNPEKIMWLKKTVLKLVASCVLIFMCIVIHSKNRVRENE